MGQVELGTVGYYLGERVVITELLATGWCKATWPNGKSWNHLLEQIMTEPYGDKSVVD